MRRLNPTMIALLAGLAILLLIIFIVARQGGSGQDRLTDDQTAARAGPQGPEERCADQETYDLIKRELFRRAAQVRGSDQAAFDRLSAYSSARMVDPVLRSEDEGVGSITCEGTLTLDLPPGVAVVGGRRSLSADISYTLQGAADGSGDVVTLAGAEPIVTPLATLARVGAQPGLPPSAQPVPDVGPPPPGTAIPPLDDANPVPPEPPAPPAASPAPAPAPQQSASPSFSCGAARTRGEIAVCRDPGLATLDRQMAAQFNSALASADTQERALLLRTRSDFLRFRDRCPSDACIAQTYQGRIREIRDIMAGRWSPPR